MPSFLQHDADDLLPLFIQRHFRPLTARPAIPVISIPDISFLAMQISMDMRSGSIRQVLHTGMCSVPVTSSIMP